MQILILLLSLFLTIPAFAGTASVENNISVEANSGGNSAKPGEIIEGPASADVQVKTIINGEVVEDIKIHKESSTGTVKIEKKFINKIATSAQEQNVKQNKNNENDKFFRNFFKRFFGWFKFW
ncbi:hypothetical protein A3I27_02060 [Candidatus Giovannonibacteria bacterium RIFCSPLOWO2_02_FULL_43_11b]|uniref:DUF5666 domain-containing protein n=1 Tax=Candidatus Giovannonibacteria bacterium RIFCSPHIGHO2_12_FULL_43_15 TaxID=1798341 RepID=A0A1F5WQV0_9BACT|nr:MAG: hypothetical protein A3B97_03975 [Candidatus Giovannonibacteria bacterium RIFCSPHIGHO2_02_FULL_43_32]OGF78039.1 MAG: hypothetical protein A3F23_02220 [Candidatus Giovannonibacteria bacterium RIFCSPHIGHO2_12_FULL_43_15]OGF78725.1 MAG: hypothetical protein A3A15_01480 [Candidatus Giovannonibacteria bacterium RIFCSPLOWO2_01_FULL_43_60]OGF89177.1 MAG: hypothetical protein A3I27_02060 [Candidatus Giovannonibacteria bacterium RIFCSPLOWO2_02_FULL_43_11b]OGF91511.1 MAG: hypothetical protein A3H